MSGGRGPITWASGRRSEMTGARSLLRILLGAAMIAAPGLLYAGEAAPKRVVSMNLCTDQLAMLVAAPGQLVSVSYLSQDPMESTMADQAQTYAANHGQAEEIYLMHPDLVIAGRWTTVATVEMLRRLGVEVAVVDAAYSLDDIGARLTEMGDLLGQPETAQTLREDYETRLAALREEVTERPLAAIYFANGYTSGENTLAGQILAAAGFDNVATGAGLPYGGNLPLELLAMAEPDILISGSRYPGASRSEEILDHPVVAALRARTAGAEITDRDWICGTPYVLNAVERLAGMRRTLETQK